MEDGMAGAERSIHANGDLFVFGRKSFWSWHFGVVFKKDRGNYPKRLVPFGHGIGKLKKGPQFFANQTVLLKDCSTLNVIYQYSSDILFDSFDSVLHLFCSNSTRLSSCVSSGCFPCNSAEVKSSTATPRSGVKMCVRTWHRRAVFGQPPPTPETTKT